MIIGKGFPEPSSAGVLIKVFTRINGCVHQMKHTLAFINAFFFHALGNIFVRFIRLEWLWFILWPAWQQTVSKDN